MLETRVEARVLARSPVATRCVESVAAAWIEARCAITVVEAGRAIAVFKARATGRRAAAITAETVVGTAGETIATAASAAKALGLGSTLAGLQARHHFGLEALLRVGLDVADAAAIAEFGKRHGQAVDLLAAAVE